jgi:HEAT repeat protein
MGLIKFEPGAQEAGKVICRAKREPLLKIIDGFIISENATLREIGLKFLQLLPEERSLETKVLKIAETDRVAPVRMAALDLLILYGSDRVLSIVMDILSDPTESVRQSSMARYAQGLLQELVGPEERDRVEQVIRQRKQEREEAINRFVGDFESWREQL